jgi:hypothetical protein
MNHRIPEGRGKRKRTEQYERGEIGEGVTFSGEKHSHYPYASNKDQKRNPSKEERFFLSAPLRTSRLKLFTAFYRILIGANALGPYPFDNECRQESPKEIHGKVIDMWRAKDAHFPLLSKEEYQQRQFQPHDHVIFHSLPHHLSSFLSNSCVERLILSHSFN